MRISSERLDVCYIINAAGSICLTSCCIIRRCDYGYFLFFGMMRISSYFLPFLYSFTKLQLYLLALSFFLSIVSPYVILRFFSAPAVVYLFLHLFPWLPLVIMFSASTRYFNSLSFLFSSRLLRLLCVQRTLAVLVRMIISSALYR